MPINIVALFVLSIGTLIWSRALVSMNISPFAFADQVAPCFRHRFRHP